MSQPLSDREWGQFFDLLGRIVSLPLAWPDKKALIEEKALDVANGEMNLSEFLGWFEEE